MIRNEHPPPSPSAADCSERRPRWLVVLRACLSDGIPRRSFFAALVVGTLLNLINQGDALLSGAELDTTKILLTFAVPYCVATYGAVSARLSRESRGANIGPESSDPG